MVKWKVYFVCWIQYVAKTPFFVCCGVREYIGIQWHTDDIYGTLVYSKHIYEWVHEYAMNIYANTLLFMAHIWVYAIIYMDIT